MATEQGDQPVLLTEGSFVQEGKEKTTQEEEETAPPSNEQQQPEKGDNASVDSATTPPVTSDESTRPATAPDASVADSLEQVQRSVMSAVTASQSPVQGDACDNELEETLSQKLEKVPSEAGDGEKEYVAPPEDPYVRAVNYMERHKVMQIFQKLTAEIVYHRPPDPLEHMLSELHKMKKEREAQLDAIISSASSKAKSGD